MFQTLEGCFPRFFVDSIEESQTEMQEQETESICGIFSLRQDILCSLDFIFYNSRFHINCGKRTKKRLSVSDPFSPAGNIQLASAEGWSVQEEEDSSDLLTKLIPHVFGNMVEINIQASRKKY